MCRRIGPYAINNELAGTSGGGTASTASPSVRITSTAGTGNPIFGSVIEDLQFPSPIGVVGSNVFTFLQAFSGIVSVTAIGTNLGSFSIGGTASVVNAQTYGLTTTRALWTGFITASAGSTFSCSCSGTTTTTEIFRLSVYAYNS